MSEPLDLDEVRAELAGINEHTGDGPVAIDLIGRLIAEVERMRIDARVAEQPDCCGGWIGPDGERLLCEPCPAGAEAIAAAGGREHHAADEAQLHFLRETGQV